MPELIDPVWMQQLQCRPSIDIPYLIYGVTSAPSFPAVAHRPVLKIPTLSSESRREIMEDPSAPAIYPRWELTGSMQPPCLFVNRGGLRSCFRILRAAFRIGSYKHDFPCPNIPTVCIDNRPWVQFLEVWFVDCPSVLQLLRTIFLCLISASLKS
eukprot:COSAG02_NODE_1829_length_10738_cov_4.595827_12_plen_155_part_00